MLLSSAALLELPVGCQHQQTPPAKSEPKVVVVSRPVEREVTDYVYCTGRTAAVDYVEIRARVTGYIQEIDFKDGAEVTVGEPLFHIDPRPYQAALDKAAAQLKQAEAQLKFAISEVKRNEPLVAKKVVTEQDFDRYVAQRDVAAADVTAAKATVEDAKLNLDFTRVTSPINGRASRRDLTVGNLITADTTQLTTIVSQDPVYAYFDVDERTMLRLQKMIREEKQVSSRDAEVRVDMGLATDQEYPYTGVIDFVNNQVNAATGTLQVRARFPNPPIPPSNARVLSPGLFVRVRLPIGQPQKTLMVVERALGTNQSVRYVYVVDNDNKVVYRPVKVGLLQGGMRVIESGLEPSDRVIISGLQRVRPGVVCNPTPGNMIDMADPTENATTAATGRAVAQGR